MRKLFKNKAFKLGVFSGILICLAIYIYNLPKDKGMCFDCDEPSGFPFLSYYPGNALIESHTIWFGLIANSFIAILFVFGVGLLFSFVSSKIASRRSPLK
ncbi:MAG TPA: hypothetical protein VNI84_21570 [Pyrinomonadaceae bacterium]|nr:hypothetical protein [Pyrinomonadaceae bacterium]